MSPDAASELSDATDTPIDAALSLEVPTELISLHLLNASTQEPLNSPVHVSIRGTGRSVILDEQGAYRTEYPEVFETLRIGLSEAATFPVSLVVEASGPGLLSTLYPLVIYERRDMTAELRLVPMENLPEGVHFAQGAGMLDESGQLLSDVIVETQNPLTNEITASITAPAGIVMHDKNSIPLSGPITLRLVHFESGNAQAIAAFPGGMDVNTDEGDALFSTAGLVSIEIEDASGNQAVTFNGDVLAAVMMVPQNIMNPDENREIADGDTIALWSHNGETGTWNREGDVILTDIQGRLKAEFVLEHLSLWNLDFKINKCEESREIWITNGSGFELVDPTIAQNFVYSVFYESSTGSVSFTRNFRPGDIWDIESQAPSNKLRFRNAPTEDSGRVVLRVYWGMADVRCLLGSKPFNQASNSSLCAEGFEIIDVYTKKPASCPINL